MNTLFRNKILIITAVWQRHDLTDVVLSYYGKLAARSKGKISLLAVGSEGNTSRNVCERNGWRYIERSNNVVSHKWSSLTEEARNIDFDFILITGSDDLLSLSLIRYYDSVYSRGADYMLGLKDLYFYRMCSEKCYYFPGYESMKTIGAGRCLSRKILEIVNFNPWHEYAINRGLDSRCSSHLARQGIKEKGIKMKNTRGVGIDVKHYHVSISDIQRIIALSVESENILKKYFPKEYERINSIQWTKAGN